jgi:UDP-N-acetylmuramyl tripeptide synthase
MRIISLWIGKLTLIFLRLLRKRGAALPGLIVEKINKQFLPNMLGQLTDGVIVVSGTNGKTTSTKMLTAVLRGSGKRVLTNPTGSNFTRGVVASVIAHSSWGGKLPYDIAVIELDEAYAAKFVNLVKPRVTLLLNVMRDQMDRFGEIDHTARLLTEVAKNTQELIILNADDPRISSISVHANCRVEYFGVSKNLRDIFRSDDELHSDTLNDNSNLAPICVLDEVGEGSISVISNRKKYNYRLSLYGVYNAQNACAVIATSLAMGMDEKTIEMYLKDVKPAFGRGERIKVGSNTVVLQLVKNPGGFRHALMSEDAGADNYTLIAINDDYADGRDVSWLWDVDFSCLAGKQIATTGIRAYDMALRLKYESIDCADIDVNIAESLKKALISASDTKLGVLQVYTTYTAMLKIRQLLGNITEVEKV